MNQEYQFTVQNCLDDFKEAKLRLINKPHNAFIGSLLYDLNFEPTHSVTTIALDSINQKLLANPEYFCTLTHEQQATVLAHEVYHYALMHDVRRGQRNPELYQKAADQVVNNLLASSGFELPSNVDYDTKYKNMSTETVYNYIEENHKNNQPNGNNNDPLGNDLFNNSSSQQPSQTQMNQMQQQIMKANAAEELSSGSSMSAGTSGGVFKQLFEEIKEGKLSWITILQEYFNEITQGELDYAFLNRRYLGYDLYLADSRSENQINKIALAFDVSGSVSEEQIKAFLNEMKLIKHQLDPEVMDVVTFNHNIVDIFEIQREDSFDKVHMDIGGGTELKPVFKHYMKEENSPEFLIVFSDLYCDEIKEPTPFNTIWICIDNPKAKVNFGKLFHITSKELEQNG